MVKIKQTPEDFIVKEITNVKIGKEGSYSCYLLKKRNYATIRALQQIANHLKIPLKHIGFAGNKDKIAITEQLISIKNKKLNNLRLKDIELTYIGKSNNPVSLGDLKGNEFIITIRNLTDSDIKNYQKNKSKKVINYYGEQRFSKNNSIVGKSIIKKDFKKAVELILTNKGDYEQLIKNHLKTNKNDYIGALRKIPKKILMLYVHSYQSSLWNQTASQYIKSNKKDLKIPLIGFGLEVKNKQLKKIINNIIKKEKINLRDFIIPQIPELSSEGGNRKLFAKIKNLKIIEIDKLGKKMAISFSLPKGSYATVVVEQLF